MNENIIQCKVSEYINRYCTAFHMNNQKKSKELALKALVMLRMLSRITYKKIQDIRCDIRGLKRNMKKLEEYDVKFPIGGMYVEDLENVLRAYNEELAHVGEATHIMLDLWQQSGASFDELCNLCNRDPFQVQKEIGEDFLDESFSGIVMIFGLDHKNHRDISWIDDSFDAPLTNALQAYLRNCVLNTETGMKVARKVIGNFLPEIFGKTMKVEIDKNGIRHLIDIDGFDAKIKED